MADSEALLSDSPLRDGPWEPAPGQVPPRHEVLWTRGAGCRSLAELLGGGGAHRASGDLSQACIASRARLLVCRRMPSSFDLVSVAVPQDFAPQSIKAVVAAVGGGPHSPLAAWVAARLTNALGVPGRMVAAFRLPQQRPAAEASLEAAGRAAPHLQGWALEAERASRLVERLPPGSLIVLGSPGGSLVQRLLLGAGARLRARAPAGAVVVRQATARAYQHMVTPQFVSPHLQVADARRVVREAHVVPVVSGGRLLGLVRWTVLERTAGQRTVAEVMEDA
ncbi:MAG: hypothetical protein M3N51_00720, partial [Actinomycetota bacterium]|nr:hypothetical protein [Actinomycetota bacterium]